MAKSSPKSYVFVADPDRELLDSLANDMDPALPLPLSATTVRECQKKLSSRQTRIVAAFISPTLGHPAWLTVAREVHTYYPGIPIFLICRSAPILSEEELSNLGVQKVLLKPVTYGQMLAELRLMPESGDAEAAPAELTDQDMSFVSLRAASLVTGIALKFDIYIKLGPGHFTRLWIAGSLVNREQFDRQTGAGVKEYFVKKQDHRDFLQAYDALIHQLLADSDVPLEIKASEILAAGENTLGALKHQGISSENIDHAIHYVNATQKSLALLAKQHPELRKVFLETDLQDHAIATTILGSLLLLNVGLPSGDAFSKLGLALMLHDVALWNEPDLLQSEELERMSPEQAARFLAHPEEAAQILSRVANFPPAFIEAIGHHHMRQNGQGFPERSEPTHPNRIAELIGICDELASMLRRQGAHASPEVFAQLRDTAPRSYSPQIVEAFEKTFLR